jgi:uncharacterized phage protein (TIGR01671 family)
MIPKFRCFDKKYKKIMKVNEINFEKSSVWIESDSGDHENRHTLTRGFDEVILMQSTGLYDDQGIEIFEGDIVEIIYDIEPFTGVVVYDLGEADFKATNNHEDYGNNFQYLTVGESIEVIGNVWEDEDLLNDI